MITRVMSNAATTVGSVDSRVIWQMSRLPFCHFACMYSRCTPITKEDAV